MAKKEPEVAAAAFTKAQLMTSEKFAARKDAVMALLADDKTYTIKQVETIIDNYMKGKVN